MSKADEFQALAKEAAAQHGTTKFGPSKQAMDSFVWANVDLIVSAMKTQETFNRANRDNARFFEHEEKYALSMFVDLCADKAGAFKRGFREGCSAFQRFIIQAPR